MTIAEVIRESKGIIYRHDVALKEKAHFDYTLAVLTGRIFGTVMSGKGKIPKFMEAYDFVYTEEEKQEIKNAEQAQRIRAFVEHFNANYKEGE